MKKLIVNHQKNAKVSGRIISILLVSILSVSIVSSVVLTQMNIAPILERNQAIQGLKNLPANYEEKFEDLTNTDQMVDESFDYLSDQWSPGEVSFPVSAEYPYSEEILYSSIIDEWKTLPGYSYSKKVIDDVEIIDVQTPHKSMNIKTSEYDGKKLIDKTIITGKPQITPIVPDISAFKDINIPVKADIAGSGASVAKYNFTSKIIEFGLDMTLSNIDKELIYEFLGFRFRAWAKVILIFRIVFPVKITIEYPADVVEGHNYELRCTALPIDIPNKNEFEINIDIDIGFAIENWWWHGHPWTHTVTRWSFLKWVATGGFWGGNGYYTATVTDYINWHWDWNTLYSKTLAEFSYLATSSYRTPIGGEMVTLAFSEIDVFSIVDAGFLSDMIYLGIGLGNVDVYGKMVTGTVLVLPSLLSSRSVTWTSSNQTQKIPFSVSDALSTSEITFTLSTLIYHFDRAIAHPTITLGAKNFWWGWLWIPLGDWLGSYTWYLDPMPLPMLPMVSFETISTTLSVREDHDTNYAFSMDVTEQGPDRYLVSLENPNLKIGKSDTIDLSISGLPDEYQAYFSKESLQLFGMPEISSSPDFPTSTKAEATLIIFPPQHSSLSPGAYTFTITATSKGRVLHNLPDPSINEVIDFTVPEIVDLEFKLEDSIYSGEPIMPGSYFPISFYGRNTGNLNDTITVNATLHTHHEELTWIESFQLDPYKSGSGQYFSSEFGFQYSKDDFYPDPGFHRLEIQAMSLRSPFVYDKEVIYLYFAEDYNVTSQVFPEETTVFANWETEFHVLLNNTGNAYDNYSINLGGWNTYLEHPDRILNVGPDEVREFTVNLSIPDPSIVSPQPYIFRIEIQSENDPNAVSIHDVKVDILAPDYVPPAITGPNPSEILVYPQTSLSLGPTWSAFDPYPNTYEMYINDTLHDSGSWTNDTLINVPLTGINPEPVGLHNVTILFRDISSNVAVSQVWVSIKPPDTKNPIIIPQPGISSLPLNFIEDQIIEWVCTEDYLFNITILRNGTKITHDDIFVERDLVNSSIWYVKCTVRPSTLLEGSWNYTLLIQDMGDNYGVSSRFLEITPFDNVISNIIEYPNGSALLGHGESFSITVADPYPDKYEVFNGAQLISSGFWQSNVPIGFNVDLLELSVGSNSLNFYFYDLAGNQLNLPWPFTLNDIDPPTLLNAPSDFTIFEHNYSQVDLQYWEVTDWDVTPGVYSIYQNAELKIEGSWSRGNSSIPVPVQNLEPGIHTFDVYFDDATGNTRYASLQVTMLDIIEPYVYPLQNIQFEPLYTADWFEFFIEEVHPLSYSLYREGTLLRSGSISNDFPVVFVQIEDYSLSVYNYTLIIEDESGNLGSQSVLVKITDSNPPLIRRPADIVITEGSTGQVVTWEILEANPLNYSLYHNGILEVYGALETDSISYSLDDLSFGAHTFTLVVYDLFGSSHACTSHITVLDITAPTISYVDDCRFVKSDPNAFIEWKAYEKHPQDYLITIEGDALPPESWDGGDVIIRFSIWEAGNYTVEITLRDTSGNTISDKVEVEIVEEETVYKMKKISPSFSLFIGLLVVFCIGYQRKFRSKRKER